jgi:hypothetical protein
MGETMQRCNTEEVLVEHKQFSDASPGLKSVEGKLVIDGPKFVRQHADSSSDSSSSDQSASGTRPKTTLNIFESQANMNAPKESLLPGNRQRLSTMMNSNLNRSQLAVPKSRKPRGSVFIPGFQKADIRNSIVNFQPMGTALAPMVSNIIIQETLSKGSSVLGDDKNSILSNVSMVSNVCELIVHMVSDPEPDKIKLLNANPIFDQDQENREWKNWGIKTFTPVKASPQVHGALKTHNFSGYCKDLNTLKDNLEPKSLKYEDSNFKPTMETLRGFGSDCTWE